jgi:hypothetical protein
MWVLAPKRTPKVTLRPIKTPQRQLVHLALHYLANQWQRLFLVNDPSDEQVPAACVPPKILQLYAVPPDIVLAPGPQKQPSAGESSWSRVSCRIVDTCGREDYLSADR